MNDLQVFFNENNINIDCENYIIKGYECKDYDLTEKSHKISVNSCKLSEIKEWFIQNSYDKELNIKKCLCIYPGFFSSLEEIWPSCLKLREELNKNGFELFILDYYTYVGGYIPDIKILDKKEIGQYIQELKDILSNTWFMFIQINEKLILLIDDKNDLSKGHFYYNDYTCYIFNVNLQANLSLELKKIEKYIEDIYK